MKKNTQVDCTDNKQDFSDEKFFIVFIGNYGNIPFLLFPLIYMAIKSKFQLSDKSLWLLFLLLLVLSILLQKLFIRLKHQ